MTHMLLGKINLITNLLFSILLDADMEDYGFEYSEEEQEEQDVDIENQYYNAKGNFQFTSFRFFYSYKCLCIRKSLWVFGF